MFALKVLSDSEVISEIKAKYNYIFVDEYQDINSVQEKIISLISSDNNIFMVGDIKQSIYGFRLCDPEIFLNKYNDYKSGNTASVSISLNKNFRSFPDILEFVNIVFDNTMTKSFGGVDYREEARLVPGKVVQEKTHARASLLFVDTTSLENGADDEKQKDLPVYSVKNHENVDSLESKKAHLEGMIIANKIAEIMSSTKHLIVDKETRKERRIQYKDIVILVHSRNEYLNNLLDVLDSVGIPISSDITSDVFEDEDILALKNMLFVISNEASDKPLFALMFSRLFGFTPDELMKIRKNSEKRYFYESVQNFPNDGSELFFKVMSFSETIARFKKLASFLMIKDLCYKIIDEFDIEKQMIASSNSLERLAKLNKFLSGLPSCTLEEFLLTNDLSNLACECKTSSNSVRVMTIHKSKGLEFPVVFLVGTGNKFNMKSVYGDLAMSKELGICMNQFNVFDRYKVSSLTRAASKIIENKKFFEEEQRLLYVALTRAIDYLFVSGVAKKKSLNEKFSPTPMSFMEWFAPLLLAEEHENSEIFDIEEYDVSTIEKWDKQKQEKRVLIGKINPELVERLKEKVSYVYPFEKQTVSPQKTTITKIAESETAVDLSVAKEKNLVLSSAKRGTSYHKMFERMTLLETSQEEIDVVKRCLVNAKVLTSEEADLVDSNKVLSCIQTESFRNEIMRAEWVKRETEFYMLVGDGERKDQTEVQGIIDLLVKVDGEIILYDYKTGHLTENIARQKYFVQLEGYREAAERIFGTKINKLRIIAVDMGTIFDL